MNATAEAHNYVCPNCNTVANGNYCPQCGQETHLHKDSFWGLLSHFVSHYFHYDSKFWKTLKALVFRPGKLTLEYRAKHRMRYIPPISLYIFVSVVFFLVYSIADNHSGFNDIHIGNLKQDSAVAHIQDSVLNNLKTKGVKIDTATKKFDENVHSFTHWMHKRISEKNISQEELQEKLAHSFPKIFFFMIPVLALLLKICFIRNKNYYFVDHSIFALHVHSFAFIAMLPLILNPFAKIDDTLQLIVTLMCGLYFILALRNVYKIGWLRSVFSLFFILINYFVFLLIVFVLDVIFIAII